MGSFPHPTPGPYAGGGGGGFENLDQKLKFPQILKRGKTGKIYINEDFMIENVPVRVYFWTIFAIFKAGFAKFE